MSPKAAQGLLLVDTHRSTLLATCGSTPSYRVPLLLAALLLLLPALSPATAQAPPPAAAQALYKQGLGLVQAGRLAEAQRLLLAAHSQAPADISITVTLGKIDSLLGRNADAVALFREVESQQPKDSKNQLNLAIALAAKGSLEDALRHATIAVQARPESAAAHHMRGKILDGLSRSDEAQSEFEAALRLAPKDRLTLYDYALLCEAAGHLPREVDLLQQLLSLDPQKAQLHALLGRALSRTGDSAASRVEFREAIRLDPVNRVALYNLSRALTKEDPAESARLAARFQALRLTEDEANTLRDQGNQGVAAMQARQWPRAIALFQAALATCAGCVLEVTFTKDLGLAQCQSGDTRAGAISLRRSLELNPNDLDTLRALELAERANASKK